MKTTFMRNLPSLGLALAFATPAGAGVLVVDAGMGPGANYAQIHAAVAAAQNYDLILVRPGDYESFVIQGKAVDIVADHGDVTVSAGFAVRGLAPEQSVRIRGLTANGSHGEGVLLKNDEGSIVIEDCVINGSAGYNAWPPWPFQEWHPDAWNAATVESCSTVTFVDCTLAGGRGADLFDDSTQFLAGSGGHGLAASASRVAIYRCVVTGGRGGSDYDDNHDGGDGGDGARISADVELFAATSSFAGSHGGGGGWEPLSGCGRGGNGGYGLRIDQGSATHLNCTFSAGQGGSGGGSCPDGADGLPINGGQELFGVPRGLNVPSPIREQEMPSLTFEGEPGDLLVLVVSAISNHLYSSDLQGVLLPTNAVVLNLGLHLPASGQQTAPIVVPDLPPGVDSGTIIVQGLMVRPGGALRLTNPSVLNLLDSQY